jgi:hypothetical protein
LGTKKQFPANKTRKRGRHARVQNRVAQNIITGNHASQGIGIYINGGSPIISKNVVTGNDQNGAGGGAGGGGILVAGTPTSLAAPQIISNTITDNSVALGGRRRWNIR